MQNSDSELPSTDLDRKLAATLKTYEEVQIELAALSAAAAGMIAQEEAAEDNSIVIPTGSDYDYGEFRKHSLGIV